MTTKVSWTQLNPAPDSERGTPCARSSHGVSVVRNGTGLILYGGEHVARTPIGTEQACWAVDDLNDANRSRWRLIEGGGGGGASCPPERVAHAQATHKGTQVYVFGGRAGITMQEKAMNDLWVLDASGEPGTEAWSEVKVANPDESPEARSFHKMICVGDSLYVFGGCGAVSGRLNDLHRFDLVDKTWHDLGKSELRGRGGPNFLPMKDNKLAVIAGFAGEETADGQFFDLDAGKWEGSILSAEHAFKGMRPRSVCVSAYFAAAETAIIFGGEVDPSELGHEGAGGFENDIVILDGKNGHVKEVIAAPEGSSWPGQRGWSSSDGLEGNGRAVGTMFVFGGLAGDDKKPTRLDDLWKLEVE